MKKYFSYSIILIFILTIIGCTKKVSSDKIKDQVTSALIAEEQEAGNTIVINDFTLDTKDNGLHYEGIINGTMNDTLKVSYKVTVDDAGDDFDAEWERVSP